MGRACLPLDVVFGEDIIIKTIHIPVKNNIHMLRPIKDKLGLKVASIYCAL
jgi:hypothetical protein